MDFEDVKGIISFERQDFNLIEYTQAKQLAIKCVEKQMELQDFIKRLDPVGEQTLIVIMRKYLVDTDVPQNS